MAVSLNKTVLRNTILFLFLIIISIPVFIHLERLPIRIWDEARLAINALEMSKNGDYLVTYYEGAPDHWNTKPPLLIWIQASLINILGFGELAVRLPSAMAALLTFGLLIWFSKYYLKSYLPGIIFSAVLATTEAYLSYHVTRTADYDALLTLFMACTCLLIFLYNHTLETRFLNMFFIFLTLGVYTKGIQALLFLPGIFIYIISEGKLISLLRNKRFWFRAVLSAAIIVAYYLLREAYDPQYIRSVFKNEIGGRYLATQEGHRQPFFYYFEQLMNSRMQKWWLLFPCGIIVGLLSSDDRIRKISKFTLCTAFSYLLIISFSKTKLAWYDAPVFPLLSLGSGIFIYTVFLAMKKAFQNENLLRFNVLPHLMLLIFFAAPYMQVINRNYMPVEKEWDTEYYHFSYYLKDVVKDRIKTRANTICHDGHKAHLAFYVEQLKTKGVELNFKDYQNLSKGDIVLTEQPHVKDYIRSHYSCSESEERKNVGVFVIR